MGWALPTPFVFRAQAKGGEEVVTARFEHPNNGYGHNIEDVKMCGLIVGKDYPVSEIMMGQSYTSVHLEGFDEMFNSVHFEFFEDGRPLNIFRDSRFNPYIGGRRGGQ